MPNVSDREKTAGRLWAWLTAGLALLVVVGVAAWFVLPRLLDSDAVRREIEARLSEALNREVTIETLHVDADQTAVTLGGVTIADPPELGDGALLQAEEVRLDVGLDALRHGAIEGTLSAAGVVVRVVRVGKTTNVHGLGRGAPKGDRKPVPLALAVELSDSRVELVDRDADETLALDGVGLRAVIGADAGEREAGVSLQIDEASIDTLTLRDIALQGRFENDGLALSRLTARLGDQARLEGSGRVGLGAAGKPTDWTVSAALTDAAIDADLVPLAVMVYPPLAKLDQSVQRSPEAQWGRLSLDVTLSGTGMTWPALRPTLAGEGRIALADVLIVPDTLVGSLAIAVGHQTGTLKLQRGTAEFTLADEWISLRRVQAEGDVVVPPIVGRVALDGRLDLEVDLMPLLKAYGGEAYVRASKVSSKIPVRVVGTVKDPDIKRPKASSVARGLLGGLVNRAVSSSED